MLAIKLKRTGKKHQAFYRIIVSERRHKIDGRCVEDLGWFNPHDHTSKISKERAKYWVGVGAQPTDTVHNFFIREGVLEGKKRAVHKQVAKKAVEEEKKDIPQETPNSPQS